MTHEYYDNPLIGRYASKEMSALWGAQRKFRTWRRLWIALAEAEAELGLPVSEQQIAQLREHAETVDFEAAERYERKLRHDVMAHVHAYGDDCPEARGIIHLGATSCYVTDNTDLLLMREGLGLLRDRLAAVLDALARFAKTWRDLPCLAYTHFQPAQPTTVGKRACLWMYDLVMDLEEIERRIEGLKFRGAKGTTGTQASFLQLFEGDHAKVKTLDALVAQKMGFEDSYAVTGQTYSRKVDSLVVSALSGIGESAQKAATDLRLLQSNKEIEEPFEEHQIGSSAMAYKRNPMRSERICGLARYLIGLNATAAQTTATQWFERTLDDSAARRLVIPQAFLSAEAILILYQNVSQGLVVNVPLIQKRLQQELPFMATENLLMAAVKRGGDRQTLHEKIRQHSVAAGRVIKEQGGDNDLLARLAADEAFAGLDLSELFEPSQYVGRAPEQVDEFLAEVIGPILARHPHARSANADLRV